MISKIKKLTWLSVFSRAGFPYFIVDLAINAYIYDMKSRLSWGYKDQLLVVKKDLITSYYSQRDAKSFKAWLKKQNNNKLLKINSLILKQLKNSIKVIARADKLLDKPSNKNLLFIVFLL